MRFAGLRVDHRDDTAADAEPAFAADEWDVGRGAIRDVPQRIRPFTVLLVVLAVAAVGWLARGGGTLTAPAPEAFAIERSSEPLDLAADADARERQRSREQRSRDVLPLIPLTWARFPDAPFDPVADSPVIALDTTVVAVGAQDGQLVLGQADLSGFPEVGTRGARAPGERRASEVWTLLPASPLSARSEPHVAAITPHRILVWGGTAEVDGRVSGLDDGAVLDVDSGEWEVLPPFPTRLGRIRTAGWVGGQFVVVGLDEQSAPVAHSWRPGEDWQELAPPPMDEVRTIDSVVTGRYLLIYGISSGMGVMQSQLYTLGYNTDDEEWRTYDYVPLERVNKAVVVPTYPGFVLMWGRPSTNDFDPRPDGLTLSADTGRWGQIAHPGRLAGDGPTVMEEQSRLSAAFTGESVVIAGGPGTYMLIYNLALDRWAALAPPQVTVGGQLAFVDGRLVRWGGEIDGDPVAQLWVFPAGR